MGKQQIEQGTWHEWCRLGMAQMPIFVYSYRFDQIDYRFIERIIKASSEESGFQISGVC